MKEKLPSEPRREAVPASADVPRESRRGVSHPAVTQSKATQPPVPRAEGLAARPAPVLQKKENRTGLPDQLKSGVESLSGYSLDDVQVHYNSSQPAQLQAHAYAQGTDIHLAPGQEQHLPHEAWHVVQQKQGRVQPTRQLKAGIPVNDDTGLEQEADVMGTQAAQLSQSDSQSPAAALRPGPSAGLSIAPVQGVFIIRNGVQVWENDPYDLQPGETYPLFHQQQPSVLMEEGTEEVLFDETGAQSARKRERDVPTHEAMQKQREEQGRKMRKRLKEDPDSIKSHFGELQGVAKKLEGLAGDSVPSNHEQKVRDQHEKGGLTGDRFRGIIKAQDEYTQSQGSAAYLRGLRAPGGDTPPHYSQDLEDYAENALRVMSSLRAPTKTVVAPITRSGTTTGQQHPTSRDQPKLEGGSSAHAYADRNRVETQIKAHDSAMLDTQAPPNAVFLSSALSAVVSTLSTMSAPTTADNLPDYNLARQENQVDEREKIKDQANLLATTIGMPVDKSVQDRTEKWKAYKTPTSPRRQSATASKLTPVKKPTPPGPDPTVTTASPLTLLTSPPPPPVVAPLPHLLTMGGQVQATAQQLLAAMPAPQHDADEVDRQAFRDYVQHVHDAINILDYTNPQNGPILQHMYGNLYQVLIGFKDLLRRRSITDDAANDYNGARGQRLPALEQFFSECGQMAGHNALVMDTYPDLAHPVSQQHLFDDAHVAQLGGLENDIDENQIREIITAANRPHIPVIGNLGEVGGVIGYLRANEWIELWNHHIGPTEQAGAASLINFMDGNINSLVMVVNTDSHLDASATGTHWISVRVTRQHTGALAIQYLDSLVAANNYSALFHSLRQFLGHVPPQPPVVQGGTPPSGGPKTT